MRLREIGIEEWAELSRGCSGLTIFHTPDWLKILETGFSNVKTKLYAITDKRNTVISLLPVEATRKLFLVIAGSPVPGLFTPYQGPLLVEPSLASLEEVLSCAFRELKSSYFAISLTPNMKGSFTGKVPASLENKKTLVIDLTGGPGNLWKSLKAETRNEVRQAEKRGVEIYEPGSLDDWLEDYYGMHEALYSRQGIKPPGKPAFYQALWDVLYKKGQLKVIIAKHEGKTIAAGIFPIYNDIIYYLDGVSLQQYQKLRANNLIQWHIILWAASARLQSYDMLGANIPSVAHFKQGFGGAEVKYPYFSAIRGIWGRVGYKFYYRYRPLIKKLGM